MKTHLLLFALPVLAAGRSYDDSQLGLVSEGDPLLTLAAQHQEALTDEDVAMPGAIDGLNELDAEPWSDSYWPKNEGGISYRWQRREAFGRLLAPDELASMDPEDISKLSPAEKYDLFVGSTDWGLIGGGTTTRRSLHAYFGKLHELL